MSNATLEKPGTDLIADVRIESYTEFSRYNRYNRRHELQACISMSPLDGGTEWFVTFTGWNTKFALAVHDIIERDLHRNVSIRCKFKRRQHFNGKPQLAVTHCKIV